MYLWQAHKSAPYIRSPGLGVIFLPGDIGVMTCFKSQISVARHAGAKRQDPQQGGVAGLVGPIIDGVLNLPLGGGLCMFLYRLSD